MIILQSLRSRNQLQSIQFLHLQLQVVLPPVQWMSFPQNSQHYRKGILHQPRLLHQGNQPDPPKEFYQADWDFKNENSTVQTFSVHRTLIRLYFCPSIFKKREIVAISTKLHIWRFLDVTETHPCQSSNSEQ